MAAPKVAPKNEMPFIKNLASSDKKLRTASLNHLTTFLSSRPVLDRTDAFQLWQGLFYAVWMCDRVPAQQTLCADLGALVDVLPGGPQAAFGPWLAGFWSVMNRCWPDIDAHRLNKFLLLVRRVLAAALLRCGSRGWAEPEVAILLQELGEESHGPLTAGSDQRAVPAGMRLHVLDIWVDECDRAGMLKWRPRGEGQGAGEDEEEAESDQDPGTGVARRIEALVEAMAAHAAIPSVKRSARDSLQDDRLWWRRKGVALLETDANESWEGFED